MQEIFTYPWMTDVYVNAILPNTDGVLALSTPPSPSEKYIRSTLLPNICKAIVKNEHSFDEFAIFEEAQIFADKDYSSEYDEVEKLPYQRKHLGCAFVGKADSVGELFSKAKGVIGMMPRYTHMEGFTFKREEKPYWADETVWLNIYLGDKKIGDVALLSRKAAIACGIKVVSAVLVELDMDELVPLKSRTNRYIQLAEFPTNNYDLSFMVDSMVKWDEIYAAVTGKKTEYLQDVLFVDEYKGKQVPEGKKSITIRLVIGSNEKTLTGADIEGVANSVIKKLTKQLGVDIRTV
jgi:phenylalanyl-tRNA synthetase beta chain